MSLHLQEMLQCDLCENKFLPSFVCIPSLDGKTRPNAVDVRKNAAAEGWKVVPAARLELGRKGKADLCPACYQAKAVDDMASHLRVSKASMVLCP